MTERAVECGPVSFAVEYRSVGQGGSAASGPTIRVLGTRDGHEYLRFDMFDVNAHYHYEPPGEPERILNLDTTAEGEPVAWAMSRLRGRLREMLSAAGGHELADALDDEGVTRAIDEVEAIVREAHRAEAT